MEERQYVEPGYGEATFSVPEKGEEHEAEKQDSAEFEAIVNAKLDAILAALGGKES